ncbi:hypothetical protein LUZ63_004051 [Rhynchospora breviuscula]|uniref:NADP-dependent oxidoreductase domain-containing protein n=1 Tax=Rhynchospora breviuscula TaxID=2022672 RepID=A0A9Q0D2V8_9POAL|nr:hypothetical protein LUZ63_004051 [Rhynchospora breviuscula]
MASSEIPTVKLNSGHGMPVVGMGTAAPFPFMPENTKSAVIDAIKIGYRHFDTATLYQSESPLGEAIAEAVRLGLIGSRAEIFVTSKIWCTDCHPELVLPALQASLRNLRMDYLDLYLIHELIGVKPGPPSLPIKEEEIVSMDLKGVWEAMEDCQRRGLTKAIGVSNFQPKKLEELLLFAKIAPAVNQVEINPVWQQQQLREFCKEKGIHVTAFSPLGGQGRENGNPVMDSKVLKDIANSHGKTIAQVSLRWLYEQGVSFVVKSFKKERLMQNLELFDWELTEEDHLKINTIPQEKRLWEVIITKEGTVKSICFQDM